MINEKKPFDNYGSDNELKVKSKSNNDNMRTLIAFDISSLPAGAIISSATLSLFMHNAPSPSSRTYNIHRITSVWEESEANWNNASAIHDNTPTATTLTGTTNDAFLSWNVLSDVLAFHSGTIKNYGWVIKDATENDQGEAKFRSKEYGNPTPTPTQLSQRPKLTITYIIPPPPPIGSISGMKFNDLDGDGIKDNGEPGLEGWTINLSGQTTRITTTGQDGSYSFSNLSAGNYEISEVLQNGWMQTHPTPIPPGIHSVTLSANQAITDKDFGNIQLGKIHIQKVTDPSNDTFEFKFILTRPSTNSSITITIIGSGSDTFENLIPGDGYTLEEKTPEEWNGLASAKCWLGKELINLANFSIPAGGEINCTFNNTEYGVINGKKFHDRNANGKNDNGTESGLEDWNIILQNLDTEQSITFASTDLNGVYSFNNLLPGNYRVCEENKDGWHQSYPLEGAECGYGLGYNITLSGGGQIKSGKDFGNYQKGSISGYKFNDANANEIWDEGESGISGWTINLSNGSDATTAATTAENGYYEFSKLVFGQYTISEVLQDGWMQTFPASNTYSVSVESGTNSENNNFGNVRSLTINDEANQDVSQNSVVITWLTNRPATSRVIYDTVSHPILGNVACASPLETLDCYGYANSTAELDANPKVTNHSVAISGLTPGTTYYYRTISKASPEMVGSEKTFTTSSQTPTGGGGGSRIIFPPQGIENTEQITQPILALTPAPEIDIESGELAEEELTEEPETISEIAVEEIKETEKIPPFNPFLANILTALTLGTGSNIAAFLVIMMILTGLAYLVDKLRNKIKNKIK